MPRKKKEETLVHLDLETMSKPVRRRKAPEAIPAEKEPETVGEILAHVRTQKKLKLDYIAQKLRIKEIYLDALEQGHYYAFPGLVYGVGFLRTYATFLGLDANELVDRFYQETSDMQPKTMDMPQADNTNALPSTGCILKALGVLVVLYVGWLIARSFLAAPETPVTLPEAVQETITDITPVTTEAVTAPVQAEEITAPKTKVVEPKPQPKEKRKPINYGLKTPARVSFVATDEVWIEVKDSDADRVLLSKVLHKDDRYNPAADAEGLVLKTANAGAIAVYVDGKFIKTLGRNGVIKSGILMNADDLVKE